MLAITMKYKHIHFIGISGISMRALAEFIYINYPQINVTGSTNDKEFRMDGILITLHNKNNITDDIDLVVYNSDILESNEERIEAKNKNISLMRRCEFLHLITQHGTRILVTGSRGKTSTTTFIWQMLKSHNPTLFVGAEISSLKKSFYIGSRDLYVIEGDESDGSFLLLPSTYTIITNLGTDHLENYNNSFEIYLEHFRKYLMNIKEIKNHLIIYNGDDEHLHNLVNSVNGLNTISYGAKDINDVKIKLLKENFNYLEWQITSNKLNINNVFDVNIHGVFNAFNLTAGIILSHLFNVSINNHLIIEKPKRRMEYYKKNNTVIIDDYGVQPESIQEVLNTIFKFFDKKDVNILWEPHRSTRVNREIKKFYNVFQHLNLFIVPMHEMKYTGERDQAIDNLNKYFNYNNQMISYDILQDVFNTHMKDRITLIFSAGVLSKKILQIFNNIA